MKPLRAIRARIVAAMVGALALAAPAVAVASQGGLTLNLTASSTPIVGKSMLLHATGTIPPQDLGFPYWFSLDAIPPTVTSTCPADRWEGAQVATGSGGSIVVLSQSEIPDAAGNFSIPIAITPTAPGPVLLCAYTDDGEATTLAAASLTLNIQSTPSTKGTGSTAVGIPTEARRGIRSCLAVLGSRDGRGCVRTVVKRANRACRRLHSRNGIATCLGAVRKIAKRYS
jgi:hypothetical protein